MDLNIGIAANDRKDIATGLSKLLADSYSLYLKTHNYHWNVTGPQFNTLHTMFEGQYAELAPAVDEIAERIRALGALAPGGLANLAGMAGIAEIQEDASASEMVRHLADANKRVMADLNKARELAGDAGDNETEDLMIARLQVHGKTLWMLESFLEE